METIGYHWLALYTALLPLGFALRVINPIQTDAMRHATTIRKSKPGIVDCERLPRPSASGSSPLPTLLTRI